MKRYIARWFFHSSLSISLVFVVVFVIFHPVPRGAVRAALTENVNLTFEALSLRSERAHDEN